MNDFVSEHKVHEIYCTIPGSSSDKISNLLLFAEKHMIRFYIVPEFYRDIKKSMVMEIMEFIPLLSIRNELLQSVSNRVVKRRRQGAGADDIGQEPVPGEVLAGRRRPGKLPW